MARPKASQTGSCVPVVAEPTKSGHRKKASTTPPEVIRFDNVIVLDSEEELEAVNLKPSTSNFGSSRVVGQTAFSNLNQKPMLTPVSSEKKMRDSRKRVLAVEDASGASMFESKCFQGSPSSAKKITVGEGNFPYGDTRTTAEPADDPDTFEQSVKAKRKHKSGVKIEMQSGTLELVELDNKENNGSDVQAGNGVNSTKSTKKRKTESDLPVNPESFAQRAPSPSALAADGPAPAEGKTCHQCRQKLSTSAAWCRNTSGKRACTQKYCSKCLLNRYGEVVAEVEDLQTWSCPRCRGICNCSMCMKKKGLAPTGGLAKKAKAAGYSSVADLLEKFPNMREERYAREQPAAVASDSKEWKLICYDPVVQPAKESEVPHTSEAPQTFEAVKTNGKNKKKMKKEIPEVTEFVRPEGDQTAPSEGGKKSRRRKKSEMKASVAPVDVDHAQGQSCAAEPEKGMVGECTPKKRGRKQKSKVEVEPVREPCPALDDDPTVGAQEEEAAEEEVVLPIGEPLLNVGDLDFPPEAVGPALQILEFCSAFEKPLRLKRVKAQKILSEMIRGGTLRRGGQSDLVSLHVQLLTIILDDEDDDTNIALSAASKNCWVYHLERHFSEQFLLSKKHAENHSGEEDDDGRATTSGTKTLPLSLWPVPNEDVTVVVDALKSGVDGYGNLSLTTRLQLLASLCDETLTTKKMRDYVEKTISSREAEQKENREELLALKKQAREIHENDAKEVMAAKRENIDFDESPERLARIKREYAELAEKEAHLNETAGKLSGPRSDALRTEAAAVHKSGSKLWRLKGAKDREVIVLQDISNLDCLVPTEAWSVFSKDQEEEVLQFITNLNTRKKPTVKATGQRQRRKRKAASQIDQTTSHPRSPEIPIIELSD